LVVELLWVQLHPDQLFHATNKRKGFEFREVKIGIEIGGHFGFHRRHKQEQKLQHWEQAQKPPMIVT
jgi:hypothetical protein